MTRKQAHQRADQTRREFIRTGGAITAALLAGAAMPGAARTWPGTASQPARVGAIPTRPLGRTGHRVTIFSLGGQGALERANNEAVAVPIVERALDLGVNYIDTSSIYGGPERWSERYIGQVMKRRRAEAFLASKTKERTRDGSMRMLEQSLRLLNTDRLDLWQLHDIGTIKDVDEVFAKGGAVEALVEARDQKMVRFLGITGHHRPECLIEAIGRLPFDGVLMALNAADVHHYSFKERLLPLAVEKQMGIIGMKVYFRGLAGRLPWYRGMEPFLRYALSQTITNIVIGCDDVSQLEKNAGYARSFHPMTEDETRALVGDIAPFAKQLMYYKP